MAVNRLFIYDHEIHALNMFKHTEGISLSSLLPGLSIHAFRTSNSRRMHVLYLNLIRSKSMEKGRDSFILEILLDLFRENSALPNAASVFNSVSSSLNLKVSLTNVSFTRKSNYTRPRLLISILLEIIIIALTRKHLPQGVILAILGKCCLTGGVLARGRNKVGGRILLRRWISGVRKVDEGRGHGVSRISSRYREFMLY